MWIIIFESNCIFHYSCYLTILWNMFPLQFSGMIYIFYIYKKCYLSYWKGRHTIIDNEINNIDWDWTINDTIKCLKYVFKVFQWNTSLVYKVKSTIWTVPFDSRIYMLFELSSKDDVGFQRGIYRSRTL